MCKLIDMLKTFPAYLIIAPGKRLAHKPHGWAPASFMPGSGFGMPSGGQLAIQSSLGIVTELAAILFQPAPTPIRDIAFFQIEDCNALMVSEVQLTRLTRDDSGISLIFGSTATKMLQMSGPA